MLTDLKPESQSHAGSRLNTRSSADVIHGRIKIYIKTIVP